MIGRVPALAVVFLCALAGPSLAGEDPKPRVMDIKPWKAKLVVLADAKGGTYVFYHQPGEDSKVWYGTGKTLYLQQVIGSGGSGDQWSISTWAPRVREIRPGELVHRENDTYQKTCDGKDDAELTVVTGDKAKAILEKSQFMTPATTRRPYLLARDDTGTYYYVDKLPSENDRHGIGHRVFVGKKGAMKQLALTDMASDTAGDVFSTKTGDLRLVYHNDQPNTVWVKGEKSVTLSWLDLDANSHLIFTDLGIYGFIGTLCDSL